tara:strand:- start:18 stop:659 length:642 start_codon:yes stop_codon:yes gene_type:complete
MIRNMFFKKSNKENFINKSSKSSNPNTQKLYAAYLLRSLLTKALSNDREKRGILKKLITKMHSKRMAMAELMNNKPLFTSKHELPPSECSAYTDCLDRKLAGDCCPTSEGLYLDCCYSALKEAPKGYAFDAKKRGGSKAASDEAELLESEKNVAIFVYNIITESKTVEVSEWDMAKKLFVAAAERVRQTKLSSSPNSENMELAWIVTDALVGS